MIRDYDMKDYKRNAFRQSKHRGEIASRVRVPGGKIDAESLMRVVEIAEKYGDGTVNLTNRQGFEIPHIRIEDRDKVNEELQLIIENTGVNQEEAGKGYPASGTRSLPITIINDGKLSREDLKRAGKDAIWLRDTLGRHRARQDNTLLLSVDREDNVVWIGKEE